MWSQIPDSDSGRGSEGCLAAERRNPLSGLRKSLNRRKEFAKEEWNCEIATGWSKETVDCNSLLTDPKLPKSVITQWFLESLYREVLVFWCFKSVRCVEFCLLMSFQYRAFVVPYKAWSLQNTLKHIQTPKPYTSPKYSQSPPLGISGQKQDNNRHQQISSDTNRQSQVPPKAVQGCVAPPVDIKWHLQITKTSLYKL